MKMGQDNHRTILHMKEKIEAITKTQDKKEEVIDKLK